MRSRDDDVDHGAAVEHALGRGVVGVGGRLPPPPPAGLDEAVARVAVRHGERVAARLRRFADVEVGAFAWTRDESGGTWLGRIEGAWWFDASDAAAVHDLQHVRACRWTAQPVAPADVPQAVAATFDRGGRNLQRVRDATAGPATLRCWEERG